LRLGPGVPNPFRGATTLRWEVGPGATGGRLRVEVCDLRGRVVRTLADRALEPGGHTVTWDGRDARGVRLPAGVYLCRAVAAGKTATRKLLLLD
jgi:flagellar hook assembly protein FlgD